MPAPTALDQLDPAPGIVRPQRFQRGFHIGIADMTAQLGLAKPKKDLPPAEECCQRGRRRELLNDVLLFLTARENGAVLVSSNAADMDLLLRFRPDARILLYGHAAPSGAAR